MLASRPVRGGEVGQCREVAAASRHERADVANDPPCAEPQVDFKCAGDEQNDLMVVGARCSTSPRIFEFRQLSRSSAHSASTIAYGLCYALRILNNSLLTKKKFTF